MTAALHLTPPQRIAALHAIRDRHPGDASSTQHIGVYALKRGTVQGLVEEAGA